jgi:hypothetical protein
MAITVLGMMLVVAGVLLAGVLVVAFRARGSRQQVGSGSGGDTSWLPAVMSGTAATDARRATVATGAAATHRAAPDVAGTCVALPIEFLSCEPFRIDIPVTSSTRSLLGRVLIILRSAVLARHVEDYCAAVRRRAAGLH